MNHSQYNPQAYTALENYFSQGGYPERADKAYIAYKKRERQEALSPYSLEWLWNIFLGGLFAYGRSPGRAFVLGIFFIVVGWCVFRKADGMVSLSKPEIVGPTVGKRGTLSRKIPVRTLHATNEIPYNPFWYSLDLFIPFVDLGFDD